MSRKRNGPRKQGIAKEGPLELRGKPERDRERERQREREGQRCKGEKGKRGLGVLRGWRVGAP